MPIPELFSAEVEYSLWSAAQGDIDLMSIAPSTGKAAVLHSFVIEPISEVGDANERFGRWKIVRGHTSAPTGGVTVDLTSVWNQTENPTSITCYAPSPGISSGGTPVDVHSGAFNVRYGLLYLPPPQLRITIKGGEYLNIRLLAWNPAPSEVRFNMTLYVEEV